MLPLWLLLCWPSPLWLIVIPVNYVIDRIVLWWGIKSLDNRQEFCRKHTWKICLAGFLGDFVGAVILFCASFLPEMIWDGLSASTFFHDLMYGVGFNPFSSILSLVIVLFAIAISGLVIYLIDKSILTKAGIEESVAKSAAMKIALITAPYLYLFPSALMYQSV